MLANEIHYRDSVVYLRRHRSKIKLMDIHKKISCAALKSKTQGSIKTSVNVSLWKKCWRIWNKIFKEILYISLVTNIFCRQRSVIWNNKQWKYQLHLQQDGLGIYAENSFVAKVSIKVNKYMLPQKSHLSCQWHWNFKIQCIWQ